jgi:hypothetical protein
MMEMFDKKLIVINHNMKKSGTIWVQPQRKTALSLAFCLFTPTKQQIIERTIAMLKMPNS